jgi:hypothetical protein
MYHISQCITSHNVSQQSFKSLILGQSANQELIPYKIKRDKESQQTAEIIDTKEFLKMKRDYKESDSFHFILQGQVFMKLHNN